ncbi:hypothetical protein GXY_15639 [Novacetimonas hansenii ATCC 23769]|uniref:Uncharacterized protein n=1 Tax=Novacetimonas hansenii ATCC 23769 TaxID=714995 RepID=D5QIZ6_NOVHA|nr:hypothetical protein GXY_15639 [Novacetimonas hansenii ATCC 23769]
MVEWTGAGGRAVERAGATSGPDGRIGAVMAFWFPSVGSTRSRDALMARWTCPARKPVPCEAGP